MKGGCLGLILVLAGIGFLIKFWFVIVPLVLVALVIRAVVRANAEHTKRQQAERERVALLPPPQVIESSTRGLWEVHYDNKTTLFADRIGANLYAASLTQK
jgi:hypothetical protein